MSNKYKHLSHLEKKKFYAMNQESNDKVIKFILVGESGSGKTSLLVRYTEDSFIQNSIPVLKSQFYS